MSRIPNGRATVGFQSAVHVGKVWLTLMTKSIERSAVRAVLSEQVQRSRFGILKWSSGYIFW